MRGLLSRGVAIVNSSEASANIRTGNFYYRLSYSSGVPSTTFLENIGSLLPPAITIISYGGISSDFRTECSTGNGACICRVCGDGGGSTFGSQCT